MTKIKTAVSVLFVSVMSLMGSASTQAALIDRGNGLIYDNVLDMTWAQDARIYPALLVGPASSTGPVLRPGLTNWFTGVMTIGGCPLLLPSTASDSTGFSTAMARPITDTALQLRAAASAGFTGNELAYMYHVNLGNKSQCTGDGAIFDWQGMGARRRRSERELRGCLNRRNGLFFASGRPQVRAFGPISLLPHPTFTWAFKYNGFNDWATAIFSAAELGPYVTAMC